MLWASAEDKTVPVEGEIGRLPLVINNMHTFILPLYALFKVTSLTSSLLCFPFLCTSLLLASSSFSDSMLFWRLPLQRFSSSRDFSITSRVLWNLSNSAANSFTCTSSNWLFLVIEVATNMYRCAQLENCCWYLLSQLFIMSNSSFALGL